MTSPLPDFTAFVGQYQAAVCATAYAVLRDRARSEEVAQEAFVIAWQKLPALDSAPQLPGWVCGIARNLARNAARRRKEHPMSTESSAQPIAPTTPLDELLDRERMELANRALAAISEVEREAIVVYYRGDESLKSVAAALGISEAAAKKRVARGKQHLRANAEVIESTLRATQPNAAFKIGCLAALATAGLVANDAAAGAAIVRSQQLPARAVAKPLVMVLVAAAIAIPVTGAAVWIRSKHAKIESTTTAISQPRSRTLARPIDPVRKQQLVTQIVAARSARLSGGRAGISVTPIAPHDHERTFDFAGSSLFETLPELPPRLPGGINKTVLREAIRSVQPLIRECYDKLGKQATGTLELVVRLESETEVGTIATDARVDGVFATNAELAECLRETLLSIELPELDDPGITNVDYPFTI